MGWHSRMKPYLAGTVQPCPILLPLYQTTRPSITYLAQWHSDFLSQPDNGLLQSIDNPGPPW